LLTPRLSAPLTAPRSRRSCRSPRALNRRSERWADRHWDREFDSQLDEHAEDVPLSAVHVRGEQEGEHGGGTGPRARCSPFSSTWPLHDSRSMTVRVATRCSAPTSISAVGCWTRASGGALCRPTRATLLARRSIAVPWRERPREMATRSAKAAATEVVAHATVSLPQPERVVVGRVRPGDIEGARIRVVNTGRRAAIVRLATRALKALRASSVSLRPRCARLTALTPRAATRSRATIDGHTRKCLTTVGGGATV